MAKTRNNGAGPRTPDSTLAPEDRREKQRNERASRVARRDQLRFEREKPGLEARVRARTVSLLADHKLTNRWIHNFRVPGWDPSHAALRTIPGIERKLVRLLYEGKPETEVIAMSDGQARHGPWVSFAGKEAAKHKAILIDNLRGCTAVAAYSRLGMIAVHIWESEFDSRTGMHYAGNSLNPSFAVADQDRYLLAVSRHFGARQDELVGGGSVMMVPLLGVGRTPDEYRYDHKPWPRVYLTGDRKGLKREVPRNQEVFVRGVPGKIKTALRSGTALELTAEVQYVPGLWTTEEGRAAAFAALPGLGSFVVLYNPEKRSAVPSSVTAANGRIAFRQGKPRREVQVWCEGDPALAPAFSWT